MSNQTLSERLAEQIVALELNRLPVDVVGAAKLHILDSIGCLLAGARLEPGRLAYQLAAAANCGGAQTSTLIGTIQRTSPLEAVQGMAAAAHCGELDDIHGGAGACIGAIVIPALLALAEEHGGSGQRLVEAAVAGYETIVRVGLSIDAPKLFARGWWPSTVCGAFGVVAAGARFLGCTADRLANALGIASLLSGGMLTGGNEGASARHLAFGRAAQNGLVALLAAEQGLTGPRFAFEDPRGFGATLSPSPCWEFFNDFTNFYLPEVAFKPYPCARQLHAGVEALLNLVERHGISAGAISAIDLSVTDA